MNNIYDTYDHAIRMAEALGYESTDNYFHIDNWRFKPKNSDFGSIDYYTLRTMYSGYCIAQYQMQRSLQNYCVNLEKPATSS